MNIKNNYIAIMAGGVGTRFWPASREHKPKQFLDIVGTGHTLLQSTINRLAGVAPLENTLILTNEKYGALINEQIPGLRSDRILFEPTMRNTAPAIAYAAFKIYKENPEGILIILPSDHIIKKESDYRAHLHKAAEIAQKEDAIVTLGIEPDHPNVGYGYIQYEDSSYEGVNRVKRFVEKPNKELAKKYLAEGNYVWNAGMFISSVRYLVEAFKQYAPDIFQVFNDGMGQLNTSDERTFITQHYGDNPSISVDYALMEKAEKVFVIPVDIDWSDLGAWPAMYDECEKDKHGNVINVGHVDLSNTQGTIVKSDDPNKLVIIDGLEDFMVIDMDGILYIAPRKSAKNIKSVRSRMIVEKNEKWG